MGDPRKPKKKYDTPMHPWKRHRIEEEKVLSRDYGLKNKREIWKHNTQISKFIDKFKDTSITNPTQARKEKDELVARMVKLGLIANGASDDKILGLNVKNMLDRRLQTIVYKKKLAHSVKQARQFIVHRHIQVNGKIITAPGFIVPVASESSISFVVRSALFSEQHPERVGSADPKQSVAKAAPVDKSKEETEEVALDIDDSEERGEA